jgi:hypothetical protein
LEFHLHHKKVKGRWGGARNVVERDLRGRHFAYFRK